MAACTALSEEALLKFVGLAAEEKAAQYAGVQLFNHAWKDPNALVTIGTIPAAEIAQLSNGLLDQAVPVRLNRLILDYDHLLICGPVFPHEAVGFSGGNKYFFPGVAGAPCYQSGREFHFAPAPRGVQCRRAGRRGRVILW